MTLRTLLVKLGFQGDITKVVDFDNKLKGLTSSVVGLSAMFASLTAGIGYFLNEAAKLEQTKIAFEVMTGSVELGQKLIKDLFVFARTTPFQITGVTQASKILLSMGIAAEDQIETLTMIGHVAAGINKPLDQLASVFGRVKAAGYLTGYEMERLRRAGVPLGAYLSEMLKRPEREILTMIRRKEISFEMFQKGWEMMVEERFPNLMGRMLTTFKGIISNIKDYIYEIVAFSGEELLPIAKQVASQILLILDSSRKLIGLKFKDLFGTIAIGISVVNKLFMRLFYRTKEIVTQFGGINKVFKIFAIIIGSLAGIKGLGLIGMLFKMFSGILSVATLKAALLGAAIILLFAAVEDFLGYLQGKDSLIGRFLDRFETKFPAAFKTIQKWLGVLKDAVEGLALLTFGLFQVFFTGETKFLEAGLKKFSEAYKKAITPPKVSDVSIKKFRESLRLGKEETVSLAMKPKISTERDWVKGLLESELEYPDIKEKSFFKKYLVPFGKFSPYSLPIPPQEAIDRYENNKEKNIKDDSNAALARTIERSNLLHAALGSTPLNMPVNIKIENIPKNANSEEVAEIIKKEVVPIVGATWEKILRSSFSSVAAEQY